MTQTIEQRSATSAKQLLWLYKVVMVSILLIGAGFDIMLLVAGPEPLLRYLFTPLGEVILTTWMATALVLGLVIDPHLDLHRRVTRIVQRIILVYFVLLVLMHGVNNLLLGNAAGYLAVFSAPAYPYIATAVLLGMVLYRRVARLHSLTCRATTWPARPALSTKCSSPPRRGNHRLRAE